MKYTATFWRGNPQRKNGGYMTERTIEARTYRSAEKKAREISDKCVYGSMELKSLKAKED